MCDLSSIVARNETAAAEMLATGKRAYRNTPAPTGNFAHMHKADTGYLQALVAAYRFDARNWPRRPEFLSTAERAERDAAIAELVLRGETRGL